MLRRTWTRLTCNWVVIGWRCHRHGHDWRKAPTLGVRGLELTVCRWCGQYRGARLTGESVRKLEVRVRPTDPADIARIVGIVSAREESWRDR